MTASPRRRPARSRPSARATFTPAVYVRTEAWNAGEATNDGQSSPPAGAFASVSAWGATTPAGLRADGSVECWG